MEVANLQATRRTQLGTKHTRRLRRSGQIPAIIYGHGEKPVSVAMDAHAFVNALHHHARVLKVQIEGAEEQYLIKAVQYDYLGTTPVHVDLMRVNLDEKVTVTVEIELRGTPVGSHEGGVLTQLLDTVEVECAVTAIPDTLRPSVADLGVNDSLLVKDLELPKGVVVLTSPEEKIATCRVPSAVEEVSAEEEGEGPAEPEMIGRAKEDEEKSEE